MMSVIAMTGTSDDDKPMLKRGVPSPVSGMILQLPRKVTTVCAAVPHSMKKAIMDKARELPCSVKNCRISHAAKTIMVMRYSRKNKKVP